MIPERDEAPALFDEGGRTDVIGMEDRTRAREFRRRGRLGIGRQLLVAIDELANVLFQLCQLTQLTVDLLEETADPALRPFALRVAWRAFHLVRDAVVIPALRVAR